MTRPEPEPVEPGQLVELAGAAMAAAKFPHLASLDGDQPRVRPVSPVRTDHFTVYVANLRQYHKTIELADHPLVELCYLAPNHDHVRITGRAEEIDRRAERPLLEEIWSSNPLLRSYLGDVDNPELIVYRIVPIRVRFMREWALEYHEVPFLKA